MSLTRYFYCSQCGENWRATYDAMRRAYDLFCPRCGMTQQRVTDLDLLTMPNAEHDAFLRVLERSNVPAREVPATTPDDTPIINLSIDAVRIAKAVAKDILANDSAGNWSPRYVEPAHELSGTFIDDDDGDCQPPFFRERCIVQYPQEDQEDHDA